MAAGLALNVSAQQAAYEFSELKPIDTITDATYQILLGSPDVKSNDFLVSKWTVKNRNQLALFKKAGEKWAVFSLFEEQTNGNFKLTEDEQYLTYQSEFKSEGNGRLESHAYFCIVDIKNLRQMQLPQSQNTEVWNPADAMNKATGKPDQVKQSGCSAQIGFLVKGRITVVRTASKDFNSNEDCIASGQYEIKNGKLFKTE